MARRVPDFIKFDHTYHTSKGLPYVVEEYNGFDNVVIRFLSTGNIVKVYSSTLKTGNIKDYLNPEVFGVGFIGLGEAKCTENGRITKPYKCWNGMLERCYSERLHTKRPTYQSCTVEESWHNFQNFAKWFEDNYTEGYVLDKDIKCWSSGDTKVYSPETCMFIPAKLNNFLTASDATRSGNYIGTCPKIEKSGYFEGRYISKICCKGSGRYVGTFQNEYTAHLQYCKYKEGMIYKWIKEKEFNAEITLELCKLLDKGMSNFYKDKNPINLINNNGKWRA